MNDVVRFFSFKGMYVKLPLKILDTCSYILFLFWGEDIFTYCKGLNGCI